MTRLLQASKNNISCWGCVHTYGEAAQYMRPQGVQQSLRIQMPRLTLIIEMPRLTLEHPTALGPGPAPGLHALVPTNLNVGDAQPAVQLAVSRL